MPNFASEVAGISLDFEAIPDLQPKAIRGILRVQRLPEENVLRNAIATVPVSDKLFKARIDDMITLAMTPEVNINADDPMVSDTWRWRSDQVHEYRQAAKINREIGRQLLAEDGSPARYAGQSELNRLIGRIVTYIDNRREYNRAMAISNAFEFDPDRKNDLRNTNMIDIVLNADKWDNPETDGGGIRKVNPFHQLGAATNRLAFITGKNPDSLIVTPDVLTALENHSSAATEIRPGTKAGARYFIRGLNVYVSQGKKNIGTEEKPKIAPLFQNTAIICSLDSETIAENQYDVNRVEQFVTADRLFYYIRFWHNSKVHVARPQNFMYITNVLNTPYEFDSVSSFIDTGELPY